MSHNITGKCKQVSVIDLEDELVKEIAAEKFKWKFLGPGKWKAHPGQPDVQADMLVAIPQEQASRYGQQLTTEQKKQMGLTGNYAVVAITHGKVEPGQAAPSGIEVTMDDYVDYSNKKADTNVDTFTKNLGQVVNAGRIIKKTVKIMNVLGKAISEGKAPPGAKVLSPGAIKAQVMAAVGTAKKGTLKA